MSPYNIDRDTRLQHHLLDTVETQPSLFSRLFTNIGVLVSGLFRLSASIAFIALWAVAIYLVCKGAYMFSVWLAANARTYAQRNALEQEEKDLESQYPKYAETPDLSFTPDSVGSPMSVASPALSTTATSHPLGTSEALARSMKKLGIYVENSAVLPAPEAPSMGKTHLMSDGYSEYSFSNEHAMIKTH